MTDNMVGDDALVNDERPPCDRRQLRQAPSPGGEGPATRKDQTPPPAAEPSLMPNADIARSEIASSPLSVSLRKDRILGMALMVTAATGFSLAGVLARQTETTAWEVVFWRSAFMVLVVGAVLIAQHRLRALAKIRAIGWAGLISASFLAASFFCFILAIKNTTVANTVVIM